VLNRRHDANLGLWGDFAVAWQDEPEPWLVGDLEDVVYNADVKKWRAPGVVPEPAVVAASSMREGGFSVITYIALLRAVNVGEHNRIRMSHLKQMFESMGFTRVASGFGDRP